MIWKLTRMIACVPPRQSHLGSPRETFSIFQISFLTLTSMTSPIQKFHQIKRQQGADQNKGKFLSGVDRSRFELFLTTTHPHLNRYTRNTPFLNIFTHSSQPFKDEISRIESLFIDSVFVSGHVLHPFSLQSCIRKMFIPLPKSSQQYIHYPSLQSSLTTVTSSYLL